MNVANIISAIGNNSSLTPIIVKDNIENASRVVLAHQQGGKVSKEMAYYEARESALEEFGTSALWFVAPIATAKAFGAAVKKKFNLKGGKDKNLLDVDSKLLSGKHYQTLERNIQHSGDQLIKSDQAKIGTSKLKNLLRAKGGLATVMTVGLITGLTLLKQKMTEKSLNQKGTPEGLSFKGFKHVVQGKLSANPTFSSFVNIESQKAPKDVEFKGTKNSKDIAFKGLLTQAAIDTGVGGVRVATARSQDEKKEYAFKTVSFVALCYLGGIAIEKGFNQVAKALKLPIELDAKLLGNDKFAEKIVKATKSDTAKKDLLHFVKLDSADSEIKKEEKIIKFIEEQLTVAKKDNKGKFQEFNNTTLEVARKSGLIKIENGKRATTKFIDTKAVQNVNKHLGELVNVVKKNGKGNLKGYMKKVRGVKYGAVLANIAASTFLTAYTLPKMQYAFREKGIGQVASPGVKAIAKKYDTTKA